MKQLLFLLLFPCLCVAQYTGNAGQKITLGEQTTADGLVWRGVLNDTSLITPFSDTSAYIILDTVNNRFYNYKRNTNVWTQAGGSDTTSIAYVNTYGTQTVNGAKTFTSAVTATRFNPTANTATGTGMFAPTSTSLGFSTNGTNKLSIASTGVATFSSSIVATTANFSNYISIGGTTGLNDYGTINLPTGEKIIFNSYHGLQLRTSGGTGSATPISVFNVSSGGAVTIDNLAGINDVGADANGKLQAATSDMNLKNTIEDSPFGLNEILLLNPVTFLYNDENRKIDSDVKEVGFIAQDVFDIIPNAVSSTGTGDLQLDYRAITATLVKAIQEQNVLIKALEQRLLILENK